jgi:hypothetical protein
MAQGEHFFRRLSRLLIFGCSQTQSLPVKWLQQEFYVVCLHYSLHTSMCAYIRTYVHTYIPFERLMDKVPLRYSVGLFLFHWTCCKKKRMSTNLASCTNGFGMGGQKDYWGIFLDTTLENGACPGSGIVCVRVCVCVVLFFSLLSCTKIHSNTSLSLSLSLFLFLSLLNTHTPTHTQTTNAQVYVEHHALHLPHQCHASRHSQSLA